MTLRVETTWGPTEVAIPSTKGDVPPFLLNGTEQSTVDYGVIAGIASQDERNLLPGVDEVASLVVLTIRPDSLHGFIFVLPVSEVVSGATLAVGEDAIWL